MNPRRLLALLAASALAVGLAACGPDDPEAEVTPTAQEETTASEEPTSGEPTEEETTGEEEPTEEESGPEVQPTAIETLWIDDTWVVETVEEDHCADVGGWTSPYTEQDDLFICGITAVGAQACALEDGDRVQCIVEPRAKRAIEFSSGIVPTELEPREGEPVPLLVTLPDDVTCATLTHDHEQHWNGMYSWYLCDDGTELLTSEDIEGTFDRSAETWTVQRSRDKGEPEATAVITATFAGR